MAPKEKAHEDLNQSSGPSTSQNESSTERLVTNEKPKEKKNKKKKNK